MEEKNYFTELNKLNVSEHVEKKVGLSYLSWPWAWGEIKKADPKANYVVYENPEGWNYFTDGKTAWVKVGVTAFGVEHVEMLPVMDNKNNSITIDRITSFEVNKSIQRCLTKAIARHGIGLYIYAGEDLPSDVSSDAEKTTKGKKPVKSDASVAEDKLTLEVLIIRIGTMLTNMKTKNGNIDEYKTIVVDVTGDPNFKVKNAKEDQRSLVEGIYSALVSKGYKY